MKRLLPLVVLLFVACRGNLAGPSEQKPDPPPDPPGTPSEALGICYSGAAVIYDSGPDWVKVHCKPAPLGVPADPKTGFALNWDDAVEREGGLSYLTFCITGEEACGRIRWNQSASYSGLVIAHIGGGGTAWPEPVRDAPDDTTDWKALQDLGWRVAAIMWQDVSERVPEDVGNPGRFVRSSPAGTTLNRLASRPLLVFEWMQANLNPAAKPLALIGSSGGADAVLSPAVLRSPLMAQLKYLAPVSYPVPFWDTYVNCVGVGPPGTGIDPATGLFSRTGVMPNGPHVTEFIDHILANRACSDGGMTPGMAAGSSDRVALDDIMAAGGRGYTGTLHMLIGTKAEQDVPNIAWAAGNLMNHPYFSGARRVWFQSDSYGHGEALTDVGSVGFKQIFNELAGLVRSGSSGG